MSPGRPTAECESETRPAFQCQPGLLRKRRGREMKEGRRKEEGVLPGCGARTSSSAQPSSTRGLPEALPATCCPSVFMRPRGPPEVSSLLLSCVLPFAVLSSLGCCFCRLQTGEQRLTGRARSLLDWARLSSSQAGRPPLDRLPRRHHLPHPHPLPCCPGP